MWQPKKVLAVIVFISLTYFHSSKKTNYVPIIIVGGFIDNFTLAYLGLFLDNEQHAEPSLPSPFISGQIGFLVQKDEQCLKAIKKLFSDVCDF